MLMGVSPVTKEESRNYHQASYKTLYIQSKVQTNTILKFIKGSDNPDFRFNTFWWPQNKTEKGKQKISIGEF